MKKIVLIFTLILASINVFAQKFDTIGELSDSISCPPTRNDSDTTIMINRKDTTTFYKKGDTTFLSYKNGEMKLTSYLLTKSEYKNYDLTSNHKTRKFNPYISVCTGFSEVKDKFGSLEIGLWGTKLPLMLALSYDRVISNDNQNTNWIGFKTYFQFYEAENNYLFTYVAPKFNINSDEQLIEYGLSYYYFVNENWYPCVSLGFQKQIPSFSLSLNYVFTN